jgi:hypothetical protein
LLSKCGGFLADAAFSGAEFFRQLLTFDFSLATFINRRVNFLLMKPLSGVEFFERLGLLFLFTMFQAVYFLAAYSAQEP